MDDTMNHSEFEEYCSRAKELQDKNDWGNTIKEYERALEIIPDDKDIIASLGFCYSQNRDYKKAIEIFLNLGNREPEFAKWPSSLSNRSVQMGSAEQFRLSARANHLGSSPEQHVPSFLQPSDIPYLNYPSLES